MKLLLAIIDLLTGKIFGWIWMDPAIGIVGALVITKWSQELLIDTGKIQVTPCNHRIQQNFLLS